MSKCPPHHYIIDSSNVGHCTREGCGAVKDFNELQEHESGLLGLKSTNTRVKKYFRPKKNGIEARPSMSAAAKKRWQDPEYRAKQSAAMKAVWQDPEFRAKQRVAHVSLPGRHHKKEEIFSEQF